MTPPSLHGVVEAADERDAESLLSAHAEQLAAVIEAIGPATAAEATGLDVDTFEAIAGGAVDPAAELELENAAALLSRADGAPGADALVGEALDELLFGMTAGVLSVDVVAAELSHDLEPREVQGILEGRHPVTLGEFAALQAVITGRLR